MHRILIIIVIVIVGTVAVFAYPPVLRSLKNMVRGNPTPSPQVTFLDVPNNLGSTVFRLGVLPKDFPHEFLPPSGASLAAGGPPAFYGLAARRVVFTGGETQTVVSFQTAMSLEMLRLWYAQQFAAKGWEVASEHAGVNQASLRAIKNFGLSLTVTLQEAAPTERRVNLVYSVRPF